MTITDNELISVIMPAYNAQKTLAQAVESVLKQSHSNLELIIVDDCSTDETFKIAQRYANTDIRIRVLKNAKNCGASQTRHSAVNAASGNWIAFLDSDDAWTCDKLQKQIALQQETNAKLIFTGSAFMNSDGERLEWVLRVPKEIRYKQLLKQNLISNSSVLILKESYQQCETVGNDFHEDFVCWLNFLKRETRAVGIDEPLLIYRISSNSKSGNKIQAAKMNWRAYRAVGLSVIEASYYMCWYVCKGIMKYKNLK